MNAASDGLPLLTGSQRGCRRLSRGACPCHRRTRGMAESVAAASDGSPFFLSRFWTVLESPFGESRLSPFGESRFCHISPFGESRRMYLY